MHPSRVLMITLLIALTGAGCQKQTSRVTDWTPSPAMQEAAIAEAPTPTIKTFSASEVVDSLAEYLKNAGGADFQPSESGSLWWTMPDHLNVAAQEATVRSAQYPEAPTSSNGVKQFGLQAKLLSLRVDRVLTANGFKKDSLNSSRDLQDQTLYDYIQAYTNDQLVCTFTISGDSFETTDLFLRCVSKEQIKKAFAEQKVFLRAILPLESDKDIIVSHIRLYPPEFAVVAVNYRRTGYEAILKKINGVYVRIFAGQEAPSCDIVQQFAIPKEVVPTCYEKNGTTLQKNTR